MAYNPFHIAELLTAYFQGTLSDAQRIELNIWLQKEENKAFLQELSDQENLPQKLQAFGLIREQAIWDKTLHGLAELNVAHAPLLKPNFLVYKFLAIAAAVALMVLGIYFFKYNNGNIAGDSELITHDVAPGKSGATLTLANGKKIKLDEAAKGELAQEAGVVITKSANGQLVYEIKDHSGVVNEINTLSTAKGETYHVRLPDGSVVWLNAASSLTYSANLNSSGKRRVKLEGEAYFEIAKDKAHPFVVEAARQSLEVLGTHFNVNAYADESEIKTTLLEGSVRVAAKAENVILKPGQQSLVSANRQIDVKEVNVNNVIAWKNGKFHFDDTGLEDVMKQFERWYNVEVLYPNGIPNRRFTGGINRNITAAEALSLLQFSNVKFEIKGKKIVVTN